MYGINKRRDKVSIYTTPYKSSSPLSKEKESARVSVGLHIVTPLDRPRREVSEGSREDPCSSEKTRRTTKLIHIGKTIGGLCRDILKWELIGYLFFCESLRKWIGTYQWRQVVRMFTKAYGLHTVCTWSVVPIFSHPSNQGPDLLKSSHPSNVYKGGMESLVPTNVSTVSHKTTRNRYHLDHNTRKIFILYYLSVNQYSKTFPNYVYPPHPTYPPSRTLSK